jgi:four helix bundle protein
MATATRFEELIAWQRSAELRDEILRLTENGKAARDWDFRSQIRRSASSAPSNLSEGFGAFKPKVFAQFARIARRSLVETRNHLQDGRSRGYFSDADEERLRRLALRAQKATTRLIKYLDSCKGRAPTGWDITNAPEITG